MKNNLKYLSLLLCIVIGFTSCDKEDNDYQDKIIDLGGYATLSDNTITVFDTNADLDIKLYNGEGVTPESVELFLDGSSIGTATVNGDMATFNSSMLGDVFDESGSYSLTIKTTYSSGDYSEDTFSLYVDPALSASEDNPTETTMDSLSTRVLEYEVSTFAAAVDDVTLMIKKNSDGTYMNSGISDLATDEGAVTISETNYQDLDLKVNDTLYYKFTATSGSQTDSSESYIAINPKDFQDSYSVTLSNDASMSQLNLATGEILADDSTDGEIKFMSPSGFEVANGADLSFIEVESDFYASADVLSAADMYAMGTPVTSVDSASMGDVYIYKVTRDGEDYYGIMKIGDVNVVNGDTVSIEIDYMEGQ